MILFYHRKSKSNRLKSSHCILLSFFLVLMGACEQKELSSIDPVNWELRMVGHELTDSLIEGKTYLSIYSEIYSETEHRTHDLTATVSLRNPNDTDTIYIDKAEYFNTQGVSTRNYFSNTIFIAPMETVEIVIDQQDKSGGSGANFIFDWRTQPGSHEPFFEAVMISTYSSQGLSFTTEGKRLR